MFKFLLSILAILLSSNLYMYSQLTGSVALEVGKQPFKVVYDEELEGFHVFCLGYDANWDGEKTEEDEENPSWWFVTVDGINATAEKKHEFPFNSLKFPFRPAIKWELDEPLIYIPHPGKVSSYNLRTFEVEDDELVDMDVVAVETSGFSHLFLTVNDYIETAEVLVYSISSGQVLQTLETINNPIMSMQYQTSENKTGIAILNEGFWGENNSVLQLGNIVHMGNFELDEIELGDLGNHINYSSDYPDKMFVAVNGSDKIEIIDLINRDIENTIILEELASPRETIAYQGDLYITTYSSDVYVVNIETMEVNKLNLYESAKYSEGIDVGNEIVAIANINNPDYSPNNTVDLIFLNPTSVKEQQENDLKIYPNPAANSFSISNDDVIEYIEIIDLNGRNVFKADNFVSSSFNVNDLELANGVYYIKAVINGNSVIRPLIIRK